MLKTSYATIVALIVGLLILVPAPTAQAGALSRLSAGVFSVGATCDASLFVISFGWLGLTEDLSIFGDRVGMIATDANGVPIAANWDIVPRFGFNILPTQFGAGEGINPVTARPITIQVFDIVTAPPLAWNTQAVYDAIAGSGAPLVGQLEYDPADDVPACASLPLGGAEPEPEPEPEAAKVLVPGPDLVAIPSGAVVGMFLVDTPTYWAPQADAATSTVMQASKTAWVYGVDAGGGFYKVMLAGKFFWVPVGTMGPNPDAVWKSTPLPTQVVE